MGVATGGALPDAAVLVHGCKDGTLQKLVIEEHSKPVAKAAPAVVKLAVPTEEIIGAKDNVTSVVRAINGIRAENIKPRVGDIAKRAGLSAADTKPILDQLGHVIGTAGWVTLKEEI